VGLELGGLALLAAMGLIVAWRQRSWPRLAPALLFAFAWMLATVVFFLFSRYRLPGLVPLCVLAGVGLAGLGAPALAPALAPTARRAALAGLLLLAWGLPRLALPRPRADLVHLNLGRLAAARGDAAAAEQEWRAALAADPRSATARLELATLAARAGRFGEARTLLTEAVALDPGSPEAWANLGAAASATGDPAAARAALDRALALDAGFAPALANRVLVELAAGDLAAATGWHVRLAAAAPDHPSVAALAARLAAAGGRDAPINAARE
jgi:tetratricopeptide (TPR) repeat protein